MLHQWPYRREKYNTSNSFTEKCDRRWFEHRKLRQGHREKCLSTLKITDHRSIGVLEENDVVDDCVQLLLSSLLRTQMYNLKQSTFTFLPKKCLFNLVISFSFMLFTFKFPFSFLFFSIKTLLLYFFLIVLY